MEVCYIDLIFFVLSRDRQFGFLVGEGLFQTAETIIFMIKLKHLFLYFCNH